MPNINLRPWREELRAQEQQEFLMITGLSALAGVMIFFALKGVMDGRLENQTARNDYLKSEISKLDIKIKEVSDLKRQRQELVERMELIQNLQGNRPVIVRVFDGITRSVPDDLYLDEIKKTGNAMSIKGYSEANSQIAELMRNFDTAEWFTKPVLIDVSASKDPANPYSEFSMTVQEVTPKVEGEEEDAS